MHIRSKFHEWFVCCIQIFLFFYRAFYWKVRIELFARQKTLGWDIWGNELENDLELAA
jgi:N6-adenosine-specific RNA methylase IME4